jgi:hypothetical protein
MLAEWTQLHEAELVRIGSALGATSCRLQQPINRHLLTQRIASLDPARGHEVCDALAALADC